VGTGGELPRLIGFFFKQTVRDCVQICPSSDAEISPQIFFSIATQKPHDPAYDFTR
jgi:hypothetical protein